MPFLPFVLLLAWQAVSRSASFALGWATALYFGQVPGRQGRILSVVSLISAGWIIVIAGFAIPLLASAALHALGVIGDDFDVEPLHAIGLVGAIVGTPPAVAAITVYGDFHEEKSVRTWVRLLPMAYQSTFMLGASVLQMVAFTPFLVIQRWRHRRVFVQVPLEMRDGADDDDLVDAVRTALGAIGIDDVTTTEASGPRAWPMRTVAFAAEHLLGSVVRGEPMRLRADGIDLYAYATAVSINGPKEDAYRVRAAIERELAFCDVYLTWSETAQDFEDELMEVHERANGDLDGLRDRLDEIQRRMDAENLNGEEWNVLYRMRLQIEASSARRADGQPERENARA